MPIDIANAVGYEPRTNPAIFTKNEEKTELADGDLNSTLVIEDNVRGFLTITIEAIHSSGAPVPAIPEVQIFRNGHLIDTLQWNDDVDTVNGLEGTRRIYFKQSAFPEIFRRGDTIRSRVLLVGGAGSEVTVTFITDVRGNFF